MEEDSTTTKQLLACKEATTQPPIPPLTANQNVSAKTRDHHDRYTQRVHQANQQLRQRRMLVPVSPRNNERQRTRQVTPSIQCL